jgi:hypothetical protein
MSGRQRIAAPAPCPRYVIPGSQCTDPGWYQSGRCCWPFPVPRQPWPFETESRAPGTGLIASFATFCAPFPRIPRYFSAQNFANPWCC